MPLLPFQSGWTHSCTHYAIVKEDQGGWYDANLIVPRSQLFETIQDLRRAGGSGVVVLPVSYIFDEEPPRYKAMLEALKS